MVLDEYKDEEFSEEVNRGIKYPCVFLEGVSSEEEIMFFRKKDCNPSVSVPMYITVDGVAVSLGRIELTLSSLLMLRGVFPYKVTLYKKSDDSVEINLNDAETLIKFIKL